MRHYALVDTIFYTIFSGVEPNHLHICFREAGLACNHYSIEQTSRPLCIIIELRCFSCTCTNIMETSVQVGIWEDSILLEEKWI